MAKNITITENHRNLTSFDLKAELIFEALLKNGVDDLNIVVKPKGLFYRKFRRDKMDLATDALNADIINLEISRDGFYDILPEKITHNYGEGQNAVQEFKQRKREEKEARHFFSPIENEFFRARHTIELYESDFFSKLSTNKLADIIKMILAVDNTIEDNLIVKMYYALLKNNQSLEQSIDNIVRNLEDIIEEKVTYRVDNITLDKSYDIEEDTDDFVLGINTTLQSSQKIFLKKYNFTIGPLKNSENLKLFFKNQAMEIFVTSFFNLFLPFHIQFTFNVQLNMEDEKFNIDDAIYKSRLGISTVL